MLMAVGILHVLPVLNGETLCHREGILLYHAMLSYLSSQHHERQRKNQNHLYAREQHNFLRKVPQQKPQHRCISHNRNSAPHNVCFCLTPLQICFFMASHITRPFTPFTPFTPQLNNTSDKHTYLLLFYFHFFISLYSLHFIICLSFHTLISLSLVDLIFISLSLVYLILILHF